MNPYRGIVITYRHAYSLSMKPDEPNTLTHQYAVTNDAIRDPLHGPVTYLA